MTALRRATSALLLALSLVLSLALSLALTPAASWSSSAPATADARAGTDCRRTLPVYPELDPGDRRAAVRTLQCAINDNGLGPVEVDGYYGPQTKKALRPLVMGREGQPPHPYRLTPLFWSQLYGLQLPERDLERGDHGRAVRDLQRSLRAFGLRIVVDGGFGPQTEAVVRDYQRRGHMTVTGRVNAQTRYFLAGGFYL